MNVTVNVIPLDRNQKDWNMMRKNCSAVVVGASNSDLGFETTTKNTDFLGCLAVFQFLFPGFQRKLGNVVQETLSTGSLDDMPLSVLSSGLGLREASAGSKTK